MNKGIGIFTFALGAAIGSFITWHVTKNKYEQILDEEAASFRKVLREKSQKSKEEKTNETGESDPEQTEEAKAEGIKQCESIVSENGYVKYSTIKEKGGAKVEDKVKPYVIAPEEYGEIEGYDTIELTYYADNVLTDDADDVIDDVDNIVGLDSLTRFGEYEDDSVHVRNDELKCDYEILLDVRTYAEALKLTRPGNTEE